MPLVGSSIKAKFKDTIYSGLKREFTEAVGKGQNFPPIADEFWLKLAGAISDIAIDLVNEIHSNAQVAPGQAVITSGAPTNHTGATVSPGKIL